MKSESAPPQSDLRENEDTSTLILRFRRLWQASFSLRMVIVALWYLCREISVLTLKLIYALFMVSGFIYLWFHLFIGAYAALNKCKPWVLQLAGEVLPDLHVRPALISKLPEVWPWINGTIAAILAFMVALVIVNQLIRLYQRLRR